MLDEHTPQQHSVDREREQHEEPEVQDVLQSHRNRLDDDGHYPPIGQDDDAEQCQHSYDQSRGGDGQQQQRNCLRPSKKAECRPGLSGKRPIRSRLTSLSRNIGGKD